MPKQDLPGDDAALLELERELIELDRALRAATAMRISLEKNTEFETVTTRRGGRRGGERAGARLGARL